MLAKYAPNATGRVLDVCTGCGIQALCSSGTEIIGVDLNPSAVENAKHNARVNALDKKTRFFLSDLFQNVRGEFDYILFNPPYLPTSPEEVLKGPIDAAFNGGPDGRSVIDRFLEQFAGYLKKGGVLLMLSSSLSDTEKTIAELKKKGFEVRILGEIGAGLFEKLAVIEAVKK